MGVSNVAQPSLPSQQPVLTPPPHPVGAPNEPFIDIGPVSNIRFENGCDVESTGWPPFDTELLCPVMRTWLMSKST